MPIPDYSVLKGNPTAGKVVAGRSPHYQISVQATGGPYTAAVNIQSIDGSEVLYVVDHAFEPPDAGALAGLPAGMNRLRSAPDGLALDFVRERIGGVPMVDRGSMMLLKKAFTAGHRHNDLQNELVDLLNRSIADRNGEIYAFGSAFADAGRVDGIHDIHMNQGNPPGRFEKDNGIWQDGALFVHLPAEDTWIAVFIAFQTQSWTTDENGDVVSTS